MLDALIVAANMYQRNALTLKELQSVQSLRDRPVEAAEKLLNIIMKQPDAVYLCFLDALKHTEQAHIYQSVVKDGYEGNSSNAFRAALPDAFAICLLPIFTIEWLPKMSFPEPITNTVK